MSGEVRRISLKSVTNANSANSANSGNSANNGNKSESKKSKDSKTSKEPKSKRFVLDLNTESEECNEFSYNELMRANDDIKNSEPNGTDPLDDPLVSSEEQNLRNLEKHFQLKYGPKKKKQMEDYIDKGMGYDETDPFIDNEEAYDELVPSTLTTQYGGFYINCGELEFRPLSPEKDMEEEEDDEDNIRPVLKRKRKLGLISAKRRRSSTELSQKSRKLKIQNVGKTVAQMLQQKKTLKNGDNSDGIEEIELNDSNSDEPSVVVSASVRDVVDSVAKGEDRPNREENNGSNCSIEAEDMNRKDNSSMICVKLPEGLPNDLTAVIDKIKKLAQTSNDGKRNFFNSEVNRLLLDMELKCRSLSPAQYTNRTLIYSHLATHLPCTKQTLMSRAKKALAEAFDYELNTAISRLKVIVTNLMPTVFKNYQTQMEEAKIKFDINKVNGTDIEVKLPRHQFPFNKEMKRLLNDAITSKINLYDQTGCKSQSISLRDYLYEFLDKEIKPMFPKTWMTLEVLKHKVKWIKEILPQEPQPQQSTHPPSHSGPPPAAHSSHPTPVSKQSTPQTQTQIQSQSQPNKVQSQPHQSSHEKVIKTQPLVAEKTNKEDIEVIERKLPSNTSIKSVSNSYQIMVNNSLSEGLVGKFMPTPKEVNESVKDSDMISIDLSTKARSSPKPLSTSTPSARLSPINLKTSPNMTSVKSDAIKSNTPSPSVSPMAMNSILQSSHRTEKSEKLSLSRDACLQKLIEQTLGDYPNSSVSSSTGSQRNAKSSSLPQTSLPMNEMFAKGFNSANTPTKESKPEICIEIASSPEPYTKVHTNQTNSSSKLQTQSHSTQSQPQFAHQSSQAQPTIKTTQSQHRSGQNKQSSMSSISSSNSSPNLNFMRTSELPKKKYNTSGHNSSSGSLIQSSNAQKMDQMLLQSQINSSQRNASSSRADTSVSITPIPHSNKANDNSVNTTKQNPNPSSRHSNSSNVITSTTPNINFEDPVVLNTYLRYMHHQMLFRDSSPLFPSSQSPPNHSMYYPYTSTPTTTTSQRSEDKDK